MNLLEDKKIEEIIKDAFGVGDNDVIITKIVDSKEMRSLGLDNSDFSNCRTCLKVTSKNYPDNSLIAKFDLNKLSSLGLPLILIDWSLNCEIIAQNKIVNFPIMFVNCRANLKEDVELHFFSFRDFEFEKDVFFSEVEFINVFENTKFKNVVFRNGSYWCRHNERKQEIQHFSFDGISVKEKLVLQDLDFIKSDSINIKPKVLKEMHIINCDFQKEVEFNGLTLDILTLSGVEFKEQVSFTGSEIKKMTVQRDLRDLFGFIGNNQRPLKNTIFSKSCFFRYSNIGSVEFGDGTEFRDLSFLNILPIIDSKSQTSEGKEKKSKPIKINSQDVKINGNFNFNNFEIQSENIKIDLLSFEGVEFGGEVSFGSINVENFMIKHREVLEDFKVGYVLQKTTTRSSILEGKCQFLEVKIKNAVFSGTYFQEKINFRDVFFSQSANFIGTTFEKDINFSLVTFPKKEDNQTFSRILSDFSYATFKDNTVFGKNKGETELYNCSFSGATFEQQAIFQNIKFTRGKKFQDKNEFVGTSFGKAFFDQISFFGDKKEPIYFDQCKFKYLCLSQLDLEKVEALNLLNSELYNFHLDFGTRIKNNIKVDFSGTTFCEEFRVNSDITFLFPKFRSCIFKKIFNLKNFKCEGEIDFSNAIFKDEVIFGSE